MDKDSVLLIYKEYVSVKQKLQEEQAGMTDAQYDDLYKLYLDKRGTLVKYRELLPDDLQIKFKKL